jgi:hypothetical protein
MQTLGDVIAVLECCPAAELDKWSPLLSIGLYLCRLVTI